ncbi:MAG: hypothetical protein BMS9Abin29_0304 [Gemmatimonadota bacterium]|nr:MAG: hypothetical protein BMS9Abin29_0304 [Gemmatimonadota bacterium]
MHDVLRQRLMRKLESLPEEQIYQVLDYVDFMESRYSGDLVQEASGLQRFAEKVEDKMRQKAMSPATIREAFKVISAADKVLSSVSKAGKQLMEDITSPLTNEPDDDDEAGSPAEEPVDETTEPTSGQDGKASG